MLQHYFPEAEEAMAELAERTLKRRQQEDFLHANKLAENQILERLNEAAETARLLGDPEKSARILMQISKFLGYV